MFLLTAILWLLLQLKWFNIHLPVQASEVRTATALPGRSGRSSGMARALACASAPGERPSFSPIAVLHKALCDIPARCPAEL